jgi:hypothetical protein
MENEYYMSSLSNLERIDRTIDASIEIDGWWVNFLFYANGSICSALSYLIKNEEPIIKNKSQQF